MIRDHKQWYDKMHRGIQELSKIIDGYSIQTEEDSQEIVLNDQSTGVGFQISEDGMVTRESLKEAMYKIEELINE